MDAVNRDILLMVFFMISCASLAITITDSHKGVVVVSFLVSVFFSIASIYLISLY